MTVPPNCVAGVKTLQYSKRRFNVKYCTRRDCMYVDTLGERLCSACGLYQERKISKAASKPVVFRPNSNRPEPTATFVGRG